MALKWATSRRREGTTLLGEVMNYEEKFVQLHHHRIYAREYAGEEPTILLMHGFPDNVHLYDRLVPHLSRHWRATHEFEDGNAIGHQTHRCNPLP